MELAKSTIKKALTRHNMPDSDYNVMTIEDALQWEDREDYSTLNDLLDAIIDDNIDQLKKA